MPLESPPLRLKAEDEHDLQIFSAYLQDAIVQTSEMVYLPSLNRFVLAVSRFRWEDEEARSGLLGRNLHERIETGIHFDTVLSVRKRNLPESGQTKTAPENFLSLLDVESEPLENGNVAITLIFSGGSAVQLEAECIAGFMQDLDLAWKTLRRPEHQLEKMGEEPTSFDKGSK